MPQKKKYKIPKNSFSKHLAIPSEIVRVALKIGKVYITSPIVFIFAIFGAFHFD